MEQPTQPIKTDRKRKSNPNGERKKKVRSYVYCKCCLKNNQHRFVKGYEPDKVCLSELCDDCTRRGCRGCDKNDCVLHPCPCYDICTICKIERGNQEYNVEQENHKCIYEEKKYTTVHMKDETKKNSVDQE